MKGKGKTLAALATVIGLWSGIARAEVVPVRVTLTNRAPANGKFLTPLWVGFHDGSFDLYDPGQPVSAAFERLVEDGSTLLADVPLPSISEAFRASPAGAAGGVDDAIPNNVGFRRPGFMTLPPGQSLTKTFLLDPANPGTRFFSYAAMVIPSNDYFIANADPQAFPIFGPGGRGLGADINVSGGQVREAGSEVSDEIPANTAFFGQMGGNVGEAQNGVVTFAPGYKTPGSGGILDDPRFVNADFTAADYQVAHIDVAVVPVPAALIPGLTTLAALGGFSLWRKRGDGAARRRQLSAEEDPPAKPQRFRLCRFTGDGEGTQSDSATAGRERERCACRPHLLGSGPAAGRCVLPQVGGSSRGRELGPECQIPVTRDL